MGGHCCFVQSEATRQHPGRLGGREEDPRGTCRWLLTKSAAACMGRVASSMVPVIEFGKCMPDHRSEPQRFAWWRWLRQAWRRCHEGGRRGEPSRKAGRMRAGSVDDVECTGILLVGGLASGSALSCRDGPRLGLNRSASSRRRFESSHGSVQVGLKLQAFGRL